MLTLLSRVYTAALLGATLMLSAARAEPGHNGSVRFDGDECARNIPFTLRNNRIYVQARVNGSKPLWAALDTGAAVCLLAAQQGDALGLKQEGNHRLDTIGGAINVPLLTGCSFALPGFHLDNVPTAAVPLNKVATLPDETLEAALGSSLFRNTVVEIHYATGRLDLYAPERFHYSGSGDVIPLTFDAHNIPLIQAQCTPFGTDALDCSFKVDTGFSDTLIFHAPFAVRHKLAESCPNTFPSATTELGGLSARRVGRLQEFQIGTQKFNQPVSFFSQDKRGLFANSKWDGAIGGDLLRRFTVIMDYPHKRMILEPNEKRQEPFTYYYYGCWLHMTGTTLNGSSIEGVDAKSPASDADIRVGDILLRVDGKPVADMTLSELHTLLQQEGADHQLQPHMLEVQREGHQITLHYTPAKL